MTTTNDLIASLLERLKALDSERAHIIGMLELHGAAPKSNSNGAHGQATKARRQVAGRSQSRNRRPPRAARKGPPTRSNPFEAVQGGPTQSIIKVLASAPDGLRYADVLERASRIVKTQARDPREVIAGVLYSMKKRGKVTLNDGVYNLP